MTEDNGPFSALQEVQEHTEGLVHLIEEMVADYPGGDSPLKNVKHSPVKTIHTEKNNYRFGDSPETSQLNKTSRSSSPERKERIIKGILERSLDDTTTLVKNNNPPSRTVSINTVLSDETMEPENNGLDESDQSIYNSFRNPFVSPSASIPDRKLRSNNTYCLSTRSIPYDPDDDVFKTPMIEPISGGSPREGGKKTRSRFDDLYDKPHQYNQNFANGKDLRNSDLENSGFRRRPLLPQVFASYSALDLTKATLPDSAGQRFVRRRRIQPPRLPESTPQVPQRFQRTGYARDTDNSDEEVNLRTDGTRHFKIGDLEKRPTACCANPVSPEKKYPEEPFISWRSSDTQPSADVQVLVSNIINFIITHYITDSTARETALNLLKLLENPKSPKDPSASEPIVENVELAVKTADPQQVIREEGLQVPGVLSYTVAMALVLLLLVLLCTVYVFSFHYTNPGSSGDDDYFW